MSNQRTPRHFIQASNLVLLVLALSIVHSFLPNIHVMAGMLPVVIGMKVVILIVAITLRLGYSWSKYLLLMLTLLSMLGIRDVLDLFIAPSISPVVSLVQIVLVVWATILVFRKRPHESKSDA